MPTHQGNEAREASYIIYGLGGNIISRQNSIEEAADSVHQHKEATWLKNFVQTGKLNVGDYTREDAKRDRENKPVANSNPVPTRTPPAGNRYNKPAQR